MAPKAKRERIHRQNITIVTDELYNSLCEAIQTLLKDSIAYADITEQEIEAAREFAELRPDSETAKELLEFLEGEEVKGALRL